MSKYETYKPSSIEWIGDVPKHWEIIRVKGNCYVKGRIGWQELRAEEFIDEGIHCVTGTDFNNQFVNWDTCYRVSIERYLIDDNIQLKEGDVLITKDGTIGKTAIVKNLPEKATLNSGIFLVRPEKARLENEYLYWILNSKVFEDYNDYTKTGVTILHLYQNVFVEMHFPLPDNDEQLAIANYLDDQTLKIDRLISNKKAQAEKLKELRQIEINNAVTKGLNPNIEMKDSGIEWLGKIPKHWEVNRLKNTTFINQSVISEKTAPDYLIKYIDISNVNSMGEFIELQEMEFSEAPSRARRIPKHNSILLSTVRTYLRAIALVQKPDDNLIASTGFAVIDANQNLFDASYLYFQMISHILVERVIANSEGVSYPAISSTKLGDIKIVIPPKKEQTEIASYLQKRTTAIDQLIKNIEAQIEKLQELRKIKIYEAVTGKIKVNAYAETTA